jgi:hypothetical protein
MPRTRRNKSRGTRTGPQEPKNQPPTPPAGSQRGKGRILRISVLLLDDGDPVPLARKSIIEWLTKDPPAGIKVVSCRCAVVPLQEVI